MIIDLTPLLTGEQASIDVGFDFIPDFGEEPLMALAGVTFPHAARAEGRATDNAGYIHLELNIHVDWQGECARCLEPVAGTLDFVFERTVAAKGTLENEEEVADYSDEYIIAENGKISPLQEISDSIAFEFPSKVLCNPDCPGLCSGCGKPLKDGDCGCVKKEHDPRWDVLKTMKFPDEPQDK